MKTARGWAKARWGLAAWASVVSVSFWCGARADAQTEALLVSDALRRAIITPDGTLLPLPAEVVCGPRVEQVSLSPRQTYALIVRRSVFPARTAAGFLARTDKPDPSTEVQSDGSPELQVLLWGPGSRRAATVWHWALGTTTGYAEIELWDIQWLAGTDTALVRAVVAPGPVTPDALKQFGREDGPKRKTLILRINAAKGTSETLATLDGETRLFVMSRAEPVALVATDRGRKILRIGASGPATTLPPISLDTSREEVASWKSFLPDGKIYGEIIGRGADGKGVSRGVALDVATGSIKDHAPPFTRRGPREAIPPAVPYTLVQATGTPAREDAVTGVMPLWMEGYDSKESGRGLISADSDPLTETYALTTAALYRRQGTLFATPLVTLPTRDFLGLRREQYKKDTLERAHLIGTAAEMLSEGKLLPPPGDFARLVQEQWKTNLIFRNPDTNKPGFTPAYTTPDISSSRTLSTLLIGYLAGPGGRAAIYYGGDAKWEETQTP